MKSDRRRLKQDDFGMGFYLTVMFLVTFIFILVPAYAVAIVECEAVRTDGSGKIVAHTNQEKCTAAMHYLMEGIYYGIDPQIMPEFISGANTTSNHLSKMIQTMNALSESMVVAKEKMEEYKDALKDEEEFDVKDASKILEDLHATFSQSLVIGFQTSRNRIDIMMGYYQDLLNCLDHTIAGLGKDIDRLEKDISVAKAKGADPEYIKALENAIKENKISMQQLADTNTKQATRFSPMKEYIGFMQESLWTLEGVAITFVNHARRICVVLQNIKDQPIITNFKNLGPLAWDNIKENIQQTSKFKEKGDEIRKYLTQVEKNPDYVPRLFESDTPTFNELFQSASDMLIGLEELRGVLDDLLIEAPAPEKIAFRQAFSFEDELGDTVNIQKGVYKIRERTQKYVKVECDSCDDYDSHKVPIEKFYDYATNATAE